MPNITGPLRGTGGLAKKALSGSKLPGDLVKSSAAAAKAYIQQGGDPPDDLVEEIARKVEAHLGGQSKKVDAKKLREGVRSGLADTAARDGAKTLSDTDLEKIADKGLEAVIDYARGHKNTHGIYGM